MLKNTISADILSNVLFIPDRKLMTDQNTGATDYLLGTTMNFLEFLARIWIWGYLQVQKQIKDSYITKVHPSKSMAVQQSGNSRVHNIISSISIGWKMSFPCSWVFLSLFLTVLLLCVSLSTILPAYILLQMRCPCISSCFQVLSHGIQFRNFKELLCRVEYFTSSQILLFFYFHFNIQCFYLLPFNI